MIKGWTIMNTDIINGLVTGTIQQSVRGPLRSANGPLRSAKMRNKQGQALVELALVLPLLLLTIMGIMEFGYIFFVYVNLSNAAREGTRYGIVSPWDYDGINTEVRDTIALVPPDNVSVEIWYDKGPGGLVFNSPQNVTIGDRVVVQLEHDVTPLTPLTEPLLGEQLHLSVRSNRTVQSVRIAAGGVPPQLPTPTTDPDATPTPDPFVATSTPDPDVTPTWTPTPESSPSPSPTPTPAPIIIAKPLYAGDTLVEGTAEPGETVTLLIVQTGYQQSGTVDANGNFVFDELLPLVAGYTVMVQGYGQEDLAVVQGTAPTPTPTLTPTPVPTGPYIVLAPACGDSNLQQIIVHGYNWPTDSSVKFVEVMWDGTSQGRVNYDNSGSFEISISVAVGSGSHTVEVNALAPNKSVLFTVSADFIRPCPAPPTPTPTPSTKPDLLVTELSLQDTPPLGTYQTLEFNVTVANQGLGDVTSLFWVDLFVDPVAGTPLSEQAGVDYVAINGLAAGSSTSFMMYVPDGVDATGDHGLVAMADTWDQVVETDEGNNVSTPLTITVTVDNPAPTPTPIPNIDPGTAGAIRGQTYIDGIVQGNVKIYVYDANGDEVKQVRSDLNGNYLISELPAGQYMVVGEMRMGNTLYRDQVGPVDVEASVTTVGVDLNLREVTSS